MVEKKFYDDEILERYIKFFKNLPEKQRRHFIALEYLRLGRGSQRYLATTFGCARQVIVDGAKEVQVPDFNPDYSRQRRKGAVEKKRRNNKGFNDPNITIC
jgi:hypothetical protein